MGRRMETDPGVVVMGEDVHRLNGGTNGATRGLADRFPGPGARHARSARTPSPAWPAASRSTAASPPVVEFMYADFMWVAADQLFNQIGKARHMYGGDGAVPLVLRSKVAMGTGYGSQHSMDPAGIFATSAGLADRRAVHALRLRRPDERRPALPGPGRGARARRPLHARPVPGPVDDLDYCLPVGKAAVRREGADVTVLTYLGDGAARARGGRGVRRRSTPR